MNMHRPEPATRHIARLVAENETMQEEIRQLREVLTPSIDIPRAWGLTEAQGRLLRALYATGPRVLKYERAVMAMTNRSDDPPDAAVVKVQVTHLRCKLLSAGLAHTIVTVWGIGYHLTPEGLSALSEAFSAEANRLDALDASLRAGRGA